jgi:hypothetical protein
VWENQLLIKKYETLKLNIYVFLKKALLNLSVDFHSRRSLSAGGSGASSAQAPAGSPQPSTPGRTLTYILESAHARRKCDSIFEESRAFRSNQHIGKINNVI